MNGVAAGRPRHEEPLLEVRDLSVAFHDGEAWSEVLKDVSFTVELGEVVGIVGESGCGKSLTALSILGLLPRRGVKLTGRCCLRVAILPSFPSAPCAASADAA